jgi:hypothetical protein
MYSATFGGRAGRSKKSGPKSKKVKCLLCGAKGHDGDACPKKGDLKPTAGAVGGAGSGITHKTSRRAKKEATEDDDVVEDHVLAALDDNNNNNPYFVFDAGCDVAPPWTVSPYCSRLPRKSAWQPTTRPYRLPFMEEPFADSTSRLASLGRVQRLESP